MMGWDMMGGYGLGHWFFFIVMVAVFLYPIGKILSRIGFSPFWSVVALVPLLNLIALWMLALIDWPSETAGQGTGAAQNIR